MKVFIILLAVFCLGAGVAQAQEVPREPAADAESVFDALIEKNEAPESTAKDTAPAAEESAAAESNAADAAGESETAIRKAVASYAKAFNAHDAAALAAHWAAEGVHVVKETGERTHGREAIEKDFATLFQDSPEAALGVKIDGIRFIKPDVATVEGVARVAIAEDGPSDTAFTAIFLKEDGNWLIDSVHETVLPEPPTSGEYLQQLEWMVGHWVDESDDVRVDTHVRWAANDSFLVRSYTLQREGDVEHQGTQVIGWDPQREQIRSWLFDSDGSFGEGTWTRSDDGWTVKTSLTRSDATSATTKQVVKMIDQDTLTVQRTQLAVEGEEQPAGEPVRMIRVLTEE